ncbi:MAG: hypothetical protein CM1200mP39_11950 [Dehalococcoidia bacterium]|nr:MAG: hypothetical protein CM1200mP39_11950 [Dehalococcoidia bacterium]
MANINRRRSRRYPFRIINIKNSPFNLKPIACLRIPNYAWQIEAERSPELRKCPIIITGKIFDLPNELTNTRNNSSISSPSARFVFETSPDLTDVMSGMPLTEATANHHEP